jgi:hypothetical protein
VLRTKLLHQPDSAITVEQFTRTRWLPTKEARWWDSSKAGANHVLSNIFKEFGKTPLERVSEDKIDLQNWLNRLPPTHKQKSGFAFPLLLEVNSGRSG